MVFGSYKKKVLYHVNVTGLTRVDVIVITKERSKDNDKNSRRAVKHVDCNNVAHLVRHEEMGVVEETANFFMQWAL